MCLLAVAPRKAAIRRDLLQNAYDHNSDGWGIMYAKDGRVIAHKEKSGMAEFYEYWDGLPDRPNIAVHFRFGTSGPRDGEGCHPFKILSKDDGDTIDLYMMHNGVLSGRYSGSELQSDTMEYCDDLTRQLRLAPALLRDKGWLYAQEEVLGNPNKVVFLEGNGRWTYLNYDQGKKDEKTGVWYSNQYSLEPVYCGHGKGKAANRAKYAWEEEDWYKNSTIARYDSGKRITSVVGAPQDYKRPWGLQILPGKTKADDIQVFWKPTLSGYQRFARNNSTGMLYRWYKSVEEPVGTDLCVVLPQKNIIRFYPKNEQSFERGDKQDWKMESGEHVVFPAGGPVTLYSASEARAAVTSAATSILLDASPALLCPETNAACEANCGTHCTGCGGDPFENDCFCRGAIRHTAGQDPICLYFPFPEDAKNAQAGGQGSIARTLARLEADEEQKTADELAAGEEEREEEEYITQLFSAENIRQLSEDELLDLVQDYPEAATIALGAAHNRPWAFEELEEVA